MKRVSRMMGLFLSFALILTVNTFAADAKINVSNANEGYFTVYHDDIGVKMKVSVTFGGKTVYYDYTPGKSASYAFDKGDGNYSVGLYRNVSGKKYRKVTGASAAVNMKNAFTPYLVSTAEITFAKGDAITCKAAELCEGVTTDSGKIVAFHNYIAKNFNYDNDFAASVRKGIIKNYTPNTNQVFHSRKGVCYDFSAVFAAMCRSQGIPCKMVKGYDNGSYHAWNSVWVNGKWLTVDMTRAVAARTVWTNLPK